MQPESLQESYRRTLLDHYRRPRGSGRLGQPTHSASGRNRTCGDEVDVDLRVDSQGCVAGFGYVVRGCAVTTATASMLAEVLPGRRVDELSAWFAALDAWISDEPGCAAVPPEGELSALGGLREAPTRRACARVVWSTILRALAMEDAHHGREC